MNRTTWETIHDLVSLELSGELEPNGRERLVRLVRDDSAARRMYVSYLQDTAELRWLCSKHHARTNCGSSRPDARGAVRSDRPGNGARATGGAWRLLAASLAVAVSLAVAAACVFFTDRDPARLASGVPVAPTKAHGDPRSAPSRGAQVATVSRIVDVEWADPRAASRELSRLCVGDTVSLESGQIEVVFDGGVELIARGKASFRIVSPLAVYGTVGVLAARVGESGRGFTIDTPTTSIIDRGTEFGVSIDSEGRTDVACFEGVVDLSYQPASSRARAATQDRLSQGEALHIDTRGTARRLVCISDRQYPSVGSNRQSPASPEPLIVGVTDNLRGPRSKKFYRIVSHGFDDDCPAFVDRTHQWNGIDAAGVPDFLRGGDYVMCFNDDKFAEDMEVRVDVARPAMLYVLISDSLAPPQWLREKFEDTQIDVGLDEGQSRFKKNELAVGAGKSIDTIFSIWRREAPSRETIVLGGVRRPSKVDGYNMYGIVAKPLH